MSKHQLLLKDAKESASRLHADRSVGHATSLESLEELRDWIQDMIDAVKSDMEAMSK